MSIQAQLEAIAGSRSKNRLRWSADDRIGIGHALVDNCSFNQALSAIINHAVNRGNPAYIVTANAQHIVLLNKDAELRRAYESADLVLADGISLVLAARLFGRKLSERVTGVDLLQSLCYRGSRQNLRVFLLGGRPESADIAATRLKKHVPDLIIDTYCPPFGFEQDPHELNRIATVVASSRPDLVFVAFGSPKQELWMREFSSKLGIPICVGVGGAFEMIGGVVRRAPIWVRKAGCEWLYRLLREPGRMWRRYTIGNLRFLQIVLLQRFSVSNARQRSSKNRELTEAPSHNVQTTQTLRNGAAVCPQFFHPNCRNNAVRNPTPQ